MRNNGKWRINATEEATSRNLCLFLLCENRRLIIIKAIAKEERT